MYVNINIYMTAFKSQIMINIKFYAIKCNSSITIFTTVLPVLQYIINTIHNIHLKLDFWDIL